MFRKTLEFVFLSVVVAYGQKTDFKCNKRLVLVPVTVVGPDGALLQNLRREQFQVREGKAIQPLLSFSREDVPVSVGIVLDVSGSVKNTLGDAKATLREFAQAANERDEMFLASVSDRPRLESDFTTDVTDMFAKVAQRGGNGSTALIDTICEALAKLHNAAHPRKALLVISDGMDNHSHFSKAHLLEQALESDCVVYTLAIVDHRGAKKPMQLQEEQRGLRLLSELATRTGGVAFTAFDQAEASKAAQSVGRDLRDQYVLGYSPEAIGEEGKWRAIKITVDVPNVKIYARSGYRF